MYKELVTFKNIPLSNGLLSNLKTEAKGYDLKVGFDPNTCLVALYDNVAPEEMFNKEYVYEIEEYSQDVRRYQITSNVKLTDEEVRNVYLEADDDKVTESNLVNYVDWSDERFTDDEILNKIKITGIYDGTEIGDDCQVDVTGDFEE